MKSISQGSRGTLLISDEQWSELDSVSQGDRSVTATEAFLASLPQEEREDFMDSLNQRVRPKA